MGDGDAVALQRGVLADLADLQIQRTRSVDDGATPAGEPSKNGRGQLGAEAMIPGVRGSAHPVVEHAFGWRRGQIERRFMKEPFGPGQAAAIEGFGQRWQPGGVLVQDVDASGHATSLGSIEAKREGFFLIDASAPDK